MEAAANDDENTAAAPGNNIFDAVYGDRISAVTEAVMNNRPDLLENLIKEGKPIDMCDNRGWFTLHHAAFLGYTECVNLLLRDGERSHLYWIDCYYAFLVVSDSCEINCQSYDNSTPLMLACTNLPFARDVVHLLCKKNADVNAKNDQGYCPLHAATCADEVDVKVIKWLVRAGGKVKAVSGHGTTPLHTLYERSRGPIALGAHTVPRLARLPDNEERMDTAKYLIKHGASQLECEEDEPRPFQQALISGCFRSAKILLEHIDKSERKEFLSYAPRHFNSFYVSVANRWIDPEFVNFLLESGADPNAFCGEDQDTLPLLGLLGGAGRETDEHLEVLGTGVPLFSSGTFLGRFRS
jgi:ankyrin repeat protein